VNTPPFDGYGVVINDSTGVTKTWILPRGTT